jgi:Fe-S-cluster-containing hydrogenase component 2/CRP-like cAMP-binding protein
LARPVTAAEAGGTSENGAPRAGAPEAPEFADEKRLTVRDDAGQLLPVDRRFMGLSGALWSQPRSVTLIAEDDPAAANAPCQMLLIKRKALHELFKSPPGEKFLREQLRKFVGMTLPELLANNRLFRDLLYVDDVQDWERLIAYLRGQVADGSSSDVLRQHMTSLFEEEFKSWLSSTPATLHDADRVRIVAALNTVLANRLFQPTEPPPALFPEPAREEALRLLERRSALTACELCRLNRLLVESALAPALKPSPRPWPLFPEEFKKFALDLLEVHERLGLPTLQPEPHEKDETIFREGDKADALYLVLSGMVRVFRALPGGETAANNLESGTSFGEAAFIDEAVPAADGQGPPTMVPALRAAGVKPLCKSYLLRLDRLAFKELEKDQEYAWLSAKFRRERRRVLSQNELFQSGWIIIPRDPPPAIADRLVLTRNILLIDMNRCTRCDQCVQGCAAAHDAQPRFHRANPELRFGHWEVARACMHCLDAPCMEACPVGAITLLDDNAVQIHRTRCIGCNKCAKECPFGVIDMYDPLTKEDAPSSKKQVANKCDLCLTEDNDPPCVAWCPYDAAQRVDPHDFFAGLKGRADFSDRSPAAEKPASKVAAK